MAAVNAAKLTLQDYDDLKKRGFLKQRQDGFFILRTRNAFGNYSSDQLVALAGIADKFSKGIIHPSTRQGLEVPFIAFDDIDRVEAAVKEAGILTGIAGPRIRPIVSCPGNNWCRAGLVDTFGLLKRLENETDLKCSRDLPGKFKVAISGCPNSCTFVKMTEIGLQGAVQTIDGKRKVGYRIYLGGCGGRKPRKGIELNGVFSEDELIKVILKVIVFYEKEGNSRQRLPRLIEEIGDEAFLEEIR